MGSDDRWTYENLMREIFSGIDREKLMENDEKELSKFRQNIVRVAVEIIELEGKEKERALKVLRAGAFSLIAQIPVITPVITAMLQAMTSEDIELLRHEFQAGFKMLSDKMDSGFKMLSDKMDSGFKMLSDKMDSGFKMLSDKMDDGFRMLSDQMLEGFDMMGEIILEGFDMMGELMLGGFEASAELSDSDERRKRFSEKIKSVREHYEERKRKLQKRKSEYVNKRNR